MTLQPARIGQLTRKGQLRARDRSSQPIGRRDADADVRRKSDRECVSVSSAERGGSSGSLGQPKVADEEKKEELNDDQLLLSADVARS